MISKKYEWRIAIRVILMFCILSGAAWLLVTKQYIYFGFSIPLILYLLFEFYRFSKRAQDEVEQFAESVHYRDFSRYFDVKRAPSELKPIRKGFNEINTTFKIISKEKETQYQYLQKILELVDTGIISFDVESGEIMWMNESLKRMLGIPYLKTLHSLQKRDEYLLREVTSLRSGESKVINLTKDRNTFRILISGTAFQTENRIYKLVAFQNVNEALDETEAKAWQKLLSVMTHEIMNSVAPISSLADTLKNRLKQSVNGIDKEESSIEDLELGIDTIKRRSEGLLKFAETYRNLNKITTLNLKKVYARDLFENLQQLMQPMLEQKNISMEIILKEMDIQFEVDLNLMEQVLINLLVNSIEAVKDKAEPRIVLSAYNENQKRTVIKIADNGNGMPPELIDKIFIPFFSTKKNGSGIGLSLCKQIMMLHKGNIQVQSIQNEGTAFYLNFN